MSAHSLGHFGFLGSKLAGDFYVKVEVVLPTKLSDSERQLFGQLAGIRNAI